VAELPGREAVRRGMPPERPWHPSMGPLGDLRLLPGAADASPADDGGSQEAEEALH
jgi:hypothetical protein